MQKILVLGCSNSDVSINNDLAKNISFLGKFDLVLLDKYKDIPVFSKDVLSNDGFPEGISDIFNLLNSHEVLVLVVPEHNGYFSSFFKNILDWCSVLNKVFLEGKNIFLSSASTTSRENRNIQFLAEKTFLLLKCKSFQFFNFNEYEQGSKKENEKIQKLISEIKKI